MSDHFDPAKLSIRLISHGMKKSRTPEGEPILPKADLYIDCRIIDEEGIPGIGSEESFILEVKKKSKIALHNIEQLIMESFWRVPTRRKGIDPYSKPFVICFMCAWGVHRSVVTKYIMFDFLRNGLGMNVEMVD